MEEKSKFIPFFLFFSSCNEIFLSLYLAVVSIFNLALYFWWFVLDSCDLQEHYCLVGGRVGVGRYLASAVTYELEFVTSKYLLCKFRVFCCKDRTIKSYNCT